MDTQTTIPKGSYALFSSRKKRGNHSLSAGEAAGRRLPHSSTNPLRRDKFFTLFLSFVAYRNRREINDDRSQSNHGGISRRHLHRSHRVGGMLFRNGVQGGVWCPIRPKEAIGECSWAKEKLSFRGKDRKSVWTEKGGVMLRKGVLR